MPRAIGRPLEVQMFEEVGDSAVLLTLVPAAAPDEDRYAELVRRTWLCENSLVMLQL
jgi:hypothetical protein